MIEKDYTFFYLDEAQVFLRLTLFCLIFFLKSYVLELKFLNLFPIFGVLKPYFLNFSNTLQSYVTGAWGGMRLIF